MRWYEKDNKGHSWRRDESGAIDEFGLDVEYHNGPICTICGFSFCQHCKISELPECKKPEEKPYITKIVVAEVREYNPKFGDDRICECEHTYYRHFDSYEKMMVCGCKYCGCNDFKEASETIQSKVKFFDSVRVADLSKQDWIEYCLDHVKSESIKSKIRNKIQYWSSRLNNDSEDFRNEILELEEYIWKD